eukprot:jgi/Chrzof1/10877/Cz05g15200.t1
MPIAVTPGPHDPFNAQSVKLAEATRIRLVLPGLSTTDKPEDPTPKSKANKPNAEAAAKARKKLSKLRVIAQKADQTQSAVVVDEDLLEDIDSDSDKATPSGSEERLRSSIQAGTSSPAGEAARRTKTTSWKSGSESAKEVKEPKKGKESHNGRWRPSPASQGSPSGSSHNSDSEAGGKASSRRGSGDKPAAAAHVPIWERVQAPGASSREVVNKVAVTSSPKVYQPLQPKTFSPTLGSLNSLSDACGATASAAASGTASTPDTAQHKMYSRSKTIATAGGETVPQLMSKCQLYVSITSVRNMLPHICSI